MTIPAASDGDARSPSKGIPLLLLPLTLYTGLVTYAAVLMRERMNPDALSYIGIARLVSEGRWAESVSDYWSPLLSWSMAPLLLLDLDPLYAARICLAVWGGILVVAWHILLQSRCSLNRFVHCTTLCLIAISTAWWATSVLSPDILLAVWLTFYFATVLSEKLFNRPGHAVATGLLGGVCYLAKSYAFPFFLAHFTLTVFLRWRLSDASLTVRRAAQTWILGIVGFLLVAGPWVGVLSSKFQKFTFSRAGSAAHAIIGPIESDYRKQLHPPAEGRISVSETPELMEYKHWSPLHSFDYFMHQIFHTARSSLELLNYLGNYDLFFFSIPALLLGPLLVNLRSNSVRSVWTVWVPATVILYTAGFTLVYNEPRYLDVVLWPLICVYVLSLAATEFSLKKPLRLLLVSLVLFSFFSDSTLRLSQLRHEASVDRGHYRAIAKHLTDNHPRGRVAASHDRHTAMYIAFHAQLPFCGVPRKAEIAQIDAELSRHDVQSFLVFPGWPLADDFRAGTTWQQQSQFEYGNDTYYIYGP